LYDAKNKNWENFMAKAKNKKNKPKKSLKAHKRLAQKKRLTKNHQRH